MSDQTRMLNLIGAKRKTSRHFAYSTFKEDIDGNNITLSD